MHRPRRTRRPIRCFAWCATQLNETLVDIIYDVFDSDKSGTLENEEFISVMQVRRFHGTSRRRFRTVARMHS